MAVRSTYHQLTSLLLLAAFSLSMFVRDTHNILEHWEKESHCQTNGNTKHLHDQDFSHSDCYICHFNFSQYLEQPSPLATAFREFPGDALNFKLTAWPGINDRSFIQQRGPPALA